MATCRRRARRGREQWHCAMSVPRTLDLPGTQHRGRAESALPSSTPERRLEVITLDKVEARPVEWLWQDRLALGKLVVVDGLPGQGKSTFLLDIAARGSKGYAMPDGSRLLWEPWETVILSYEDSAADTIRPRIEAAGGDAARVHYVEGVGVGHGVGPAPVTMPEDLDLLDRLLGELPDVRLAVIDPLMAGLSHRINSHHDQSSRLVMAHLAAIADKRNVCVACVRHFKKDAGTNAITAGGGAIGIIGQARTGLVVVPHPERPGDRDLALLAISKNNLAPEAASQAFRKITQVIETPSGEMDTVRLEWLGDVPYTADDALAMLAKHSSGQPASREPASRVAGWLTDLLASGPLDRKDVLRRAAEAGFAERTVDYTAKRLGLIREVHGFGSEKASAWSLPVAARAADPGPAAVAPSSHIADVGIPV